MKKIVALVLSLVMALSLCTVAFGVDYIKGNKMYNVKSTGEPDYNGTWSIDVKYTKPVTNANGTGYIGYYQQKDANGNVVQPERLFVPCDRNDAETVYAVNADNSFLTYVRYTDSLYYEGTASAVSKNDGPADCTTTHYLSDGYLFKGDFYVDADKASGNPVNLLVNGKLVKAVNVSNNENFVVWASHVLLKGTKNDKTGWYECKCAICGGTFACTNDMGVLKTNAIKEGDTFSYYTADASKVITEQKAAGKYSLPVGTPLADNYTWCWTLTAGSTDNKKDDTKKPGVDSAKTFDAGIAMYVGMSLLSVAGSAVVIGKKKEF